MSLEAFDIQEAAREVVKKANAVYENIIGPYLNWDDPDRLDSPPTTAWFLKKKNLITFGKVLFVAGAAVGGFLGTYKLMNTIPSTPITNLLRGISAPELGGAVICAWVASKIVGLNLKF